jgi:hypothetical protein
MLEINNKLSKQLEIEERNSTQTCIENFYKTKKPATLNDARVTKLDSSIDGHIVVCGIVKGIKNLILPLRSKF